ncbi:hypothetical protein H4S14_003085 [Agrobacterium vitis]|nr:hypothetical protein [Agrobacterium vitis]MBE1439322.1 hypothetical protein [Agrobacterium vitis]
MRFVLLRYDYLTEHPTIEAMDKSRPHAIVVIEVNGLRFAIPLRTHLRHKQGFPTINDCGLDYSKCLLIFEDKDISRDIKLESAAEFKIINEHEHKIIKDFKKYVDKYIKAVLKEDKFVLNEYRFSTLQNYHDQLGI